jgi:hypothetical protein
MLNLTKFADLCVDQTAFHAQLVFLVFVFPGLFAFCTRFELLIKAGVAKVIAPAFFFGLFSATMAKEHLPFLVDGSHLI